MEKFLFISGCIITCITCVTGIKLKIEWKQNKED